MFIVFATLLGGTDGPVDEAEVLAAIAAARVGNVRAAKQLYELHVKRLFRAIRPHVGSDADAEDAVQAAFVDALTHLHRYHPREDRRFLSWLVTLGLNRARKHFAFGTRQRPTAPLDVALLSDAQGQVVDPRGAVEQRRVLLSALAELSERDRTVVSLFYGAELTAEEVAALTDLSAANVRKICERRRLELLARLGVHGDEAPGANP